MKNNNTFKRINLLDERLYTKEQHPHGMTTLAPKTFKHTGIDGYYVSHDGYVMSIKRKGFPIILNEYDNGRGYSQVILYDNGKPKKDYIHRLVGKAWIPNPMDKAEVNHRNKDKKNNHVDNLEWNTREENIKHKCWLDRLRKCCGDNYMKSNQELENVA